MFSRYCHLTTQRLRYVLLIGSTLFLILIGRSAVAAEELTFTVNSTLDAVDTNPGDGICATAPPDSACTLRAAIMESNVRPGLGLILLPSGVYTLTVSGQEEQGAASGDLDIFDSLIIHGAGAATTVIDGGGIDRVLILPPIRSWCRLKGLLSVMVSRV